MCPAWCVVEVWRASTGTRTCFSLPAETCSKNGKARRLGLCFSVFNAAVSPASTPVISAEQTHQIPHSTCVRLGSVVASSTARASFARSVRAVGTVVIVKKTLGMVPL